MNLLYLHAHDLGRWIAPYGYAADTPNLSALAADSGSVRFDNAHCAAPTCSPSRAALLTGMSPHEAGMMGLMHRGFRLKNPRQHLACFLQEHGFETALSGIQHIQPGDGMAGYTHRFKGAKSLTGEGAMDWRTYDRSVAEAAAGFLDGAGESAPFFLDCGFWLPHRPFPDPDMDLDAIDLPEGVADTPAIRNDMAGFLAGVRHMDECCGIVLDALENGRHAEDTVVIFTTDHGPAFPGYKCNLTAKGTGVALVMRIPGDGRATATDALVSQVDLFPTFCELLDLDPPPWIRGGRSLGPLIEGKADAIRESAFGEVTYHAGYEPMRSVRTRSHSLIRLFEDDRSPVPANVDDSAMKDAMIESGWLEERRDPVRLFDLSADPGETRNVAGDPACAGIRAKLEQQLARWMLETNDPLLAGSIPVPDGGYANDRSHLSPTIGES